MEVGFYKQVEAQLGVPVIDPSIAALKRAEYGAMLKRDCGFKPSRKWSCEAPPEKEIAHIGSFDSDAPFGGRIIVPPSNHGELQ
jgi:allantoin racemase